MKYLYIALLAFLPTVVSLCFYQDVSAQEQEQQAEDPEQEQQAEDPEQEEGVESEEFEEE